MNDHPDHTPPERPVTEPGTTPLAPPVAGYPTPEIPPAAPYPTAAPPAPARQHSGAAVAVVLSLVVAVVVGCTAGLAGGVIASRLAWVGGAAPASTVRVVPAETDEPVAAAAIAAVPSVVNIDVAGASGSGSGLPEGHPDAPVTGNGSGVAFRAGEDGGTYLLTNNHVVEDATRIVVHDSSGERYDGEIVGRDPDTDIAVVFVDGDIPAIELGDSADAQVGQLVVAIGSPFGLEHSVTSGVISAIGRSLPDFARADEGVYPLVDVIQTDAAINPGNSGGALVDREGRLLGINTAIYSRTGASGGIGFAVPVNTAVRVATQIIEDGEVQHPFLGVLGQTLDAATAEEMGLTVREGALIVEALPGTKAAEAGIVPDDVIVALEGQPIRSMDDLILAVRRRAIGEFVTLEIVRDGERIELEMEVGIKPARMQSSPEETETP